MECRLAGETEVLGENLPQLYFCPSQNPTWPDLGLNPGRRGGKPATNRLSYGATSNCLGSLGCRDRKFESYSRHGCLCVCTFILCLCCPV
jgi:hypothetical protein